MRKWLFIWMFMVNCVYAQQVNVNFVKAETYTCNVSMLCGVNVECFLHMGYERTKGTLRVKPRVVTYTYKIRSALIDTVVRGTVQVIHDTTLNLDVYLGEKIVELMEVEIDGGQGSVFGRSHLRQVEGYAIYAGKKTEVINMAQSKANLATNNGRQVYAKIAGLNIWESDAAGIQLGIGGRGLSPNRTSNFNTRQNGYDISADALGYPESYYSPVPDMVERIEVIRGASSLQYGTQFGGLVNFKMKKAVADKRLHGMAKYSAGSYDFYNATHQLSYGTKKLGFFAAHQYKTGEGFRKYSAFDFHSGYFNFYYTPKRNFSLGADLTKMYYLAQQPGGLTDQQFNRDPYQVNRKRNWFVVNWNLAAVYAEYHFTEKTKLNTRFFGLMSDRKNVGFLGQINRPDIGQPREVMAGTFQNFGNETRLLTHYSIRKKSNTLLVGTRYYQGKTLAQQALASRNNGPWFEFMNDEADYSDYTFPSRNFAAFAENIFRLSHKLSITPGVRYEHIDTRSDGYYYQRNFDLSGDTLLELKHYSQSKNIRQFVLGGVGLSYKPFYGVEVFANFSQNYRAINFSDIALVNPNFKVDPNIKDESGYTADIGIRGSRKKWLSYDFSAFYLQYNNRIGEVFDRDEFTYVVLRYRTNIGDSYNYGIESFAEIDPIALFCDSSQWSMPLFVNYSWIHAYYRGNSEKYVVDGNRVEFVPEHMLRLGASLQYRKLYVGVNYSYISDQYSDATNATDAPNAIYGLIPAYWVTDVSAGVQVRNVKLALHANNVTNNFYYTRRATGYPGPGIIPSEPRTIYLSVSVNW